MIKYLSVLLFLFQSLYLVSQENNVDSLKNKTEKEKKHFFLYGHHDKKAGVKHLNEIQQLDSTNYFAKYKDTLVSHTFHFNHLKKYQSGLYELDVNKANTENVLYDIQKASGTHISIIGELPNDISTHQESFNIEHIMDELCYENGWVFVNQQNHFIVYANNAEKIIGDKEIVYQYYPRNVEAAELKEKVENLIDDIDLKVLESQNLIVFTGTLNQIYKTISFFRMFDKAPKIVNIELLVVEYRHGKNFNWNFNVTDGSFGRINEANYNPAAGVNFSYNFLSTLDPNFKVNLSALVENEFANIVTNPHVVTENKEEANIEINESKYVQLQTATINGVTTNLQKIETGIKLNVSPVIMSNELIELNLSTTNSFFLPQEIEGEISTLDNSLETKVLIRNGETLIIGGLVKAEESNGKGGIPVLRSIPVIGLLFSKIEKRKNYVETVIYITPYIDPIIPPKGYHSQQKVNEINKKIMNEGKKLENKGIRKLY